MTKIVSRKKRRIEWNVSSENISDPPVHHWTILIVNEPREIASIRQGLLELLSPTDPDRIVASGLIPSSGGLHYRVITLDSYLRCNPTEVQLKESYSGEIIRNKHLGTHRAQDGLANYVNRMFS